MSYQRQGNLYEDEEDILLSRRNQSDLRWAAQEWQADSVYKYQKNMDIKEIMSQIKSSDRIKRVIKKLETNGKETNMDLNNKVDKLIEEMAHTLDISTIRKFALILPKIMKSIYGQVYVNRSGIQKLKTVLRETPVIFLPTHRSYADFILISYIAFHYNLPFPVIAAGMDFMNMSIIGNMLRGAGAFYIKRSFMNDELYSAVFHEYVQVVFCHSGQPMEFFLEGTRSRSGKSLPPKIGLLSCITECWLRAKVPDILIVPISISYNRTLEESLYAYEMLGVPKPKESTSGLLKGMKILREDFGNIYVHFGNIISASDFMNTKVNRTILSSNPPHLVVASKEELSACEALALHVLKQLQKNSVISVWSLCCTVLLDLLWKGLYCIPFKSLLERTNHLVVMAQSLQTRVECFNHKEVEDNLRKSMITHHNLVSLDPQDIVYLHSIHQENFMAPEAKMKLSEKSISHAVFHLHLQHYVNQSIHVFIRPALVTLSLTKQSQSYESIQRKFSYLCRIFSQDFIFEKEDEANDFGKALHYLLQSNLVVEDSEGLRIITDGSPVHNYFGTLSILRGVLSPFVLCYSTIVQVINSKDVWSSEQEVINCLQERLQLIVSENGMYSALSLDTCRNAVKSIIKLGALQKSSLEGVTDLRTCPAELSLISRILEPAQSHDQSLRAKL